MPAHNKLYSALFILLMLGGCGQSTSNTEATEFSIDSYKGKWLVLNYWAEWCAPCIKEIPELNKLDNDYSDELDVLAVNFDRIKGEALTQLSARMGIRFETVENDPADILRLSRPASLPTTYLFDREGVLLAKLVGPQTIESIIRMTNIQPIENQEK